MNLDIDSCIKRAKARRRAEFFKLYPSIVSGIYGLFSRMDLCDNYLYAYALFVLFPKISTIKSLGFILNSDANRSVYYRGLQVGQDAHYSNITTSKLHPM
jgi:hypothetical protein